MKVSAKVTVKGIVQGVGFRPFVNKLAVKHDLCGNVSNTTGSVSINLYGNKTDIESFCYDITKRKPLAAIISGIDIKFDPKIKKYQDFKIVRSRTSKEMKLIPPDMAVCSKCHNEMVDADNRRYKYPFINCTDCGPRFTIIKNTPYDRINTTMNSFVLCHECAKEYGDIRNRRYHAEPNACPVCGPAVVLCDKKRKPIAQNGEAVVRVISELKKGSIIAVKGLGGYHIVCNASDDPAVHRLQKRKKRSRKPLAVMSRNIETIMKYAHVSANDKRLLNSPRAPIVLLKRKKKSALSHRIAEGLEQIGCFLPYTPLHHLLFEKGINNLVMTSANIAEEPIQYKDNTAFAALSGIVDFFLVHDRDIYTAADDSVVKPSKSADVIIRRSRGYVPEPIFLEKKHVDVIGAGALLKNIACFLKDDMAIMSQHIGDLENSRAMKYYEQTIERFTSFYEMKPKIIVCDKHPDYMSTRFAQEYAKEKKIKLIQIQHHYSHLLSVMAENNHFKNTIGVIFDGTGLGDDGNIWGSEFLIGDFKGFKRAGHFTYRKIPGGDKGSKEAYRNAISLLVDSGLESYAAKRYFKYQPKLIMQMMQKNINSHLSSGMGRLFDAVASITGICDISTYDAEAPMRLEAAAMRYKGEPDVYPYIVHEVKDKYEDKVLIPDVVPMIIEIVKDLKTKSKEYISAAFHNTIAHITLDTVKILSERSKIRDIALSGGVFQNTVLLEMVVGLLKKEDFNILLHTKLSPNDSGIALGQAVYGSKNI